MVAARATTVDGEPSTITFRTRPPDETWSWLEPLLGLVGVTRLADVTGLDLVGIPVWLAVRPASKTLSVSQGKGTTAMQAKVSAAMEATELWHAENLAGDVEAVPARALGARPYRWDELSLARPTLVHDDLPLGWLIGTGLVTGTSIPVPLDCVRLDDSYAPQWTPPLFNATSTGLAGGNTVTEASVHALCEVIERDAAASLHGLPPTRWHAVDLASIDDDTCRGLVDRFVAAGMRLRVYADTGRVGVPFVEVRVRAETAPTAFAGTGCHPDPTMALARALTEAAQSRLTFISGSRDDDVRPYRSSAAWTPLAPILPPVAPTVDWAAMTDQSTSTLDGDLARLADLTTAATGREPIRMVLPSPVGVPVVKVIAPGLHDCSRW
jgi:ribosomal protein S12 methylthiotransferase accessory factor